MRGLDMSTPLPEPTVIVNGDVGIQHDEQLTPPINYDWLILQELKTTNRLLKAFIRRMTLFRRWVSNGKVHCGYLRICACLYPGGNAGSICCCGGAIPTKREIDLEVTDILLEPDAFDTEKFMKLYQEFFGA